MVSVLPASARAAVNIFACAPEWGALAGEIGGDKVDVTVATTARQDVHHVTAKPSLLAAMRRADLVLCSGAGLESGWLPILIQKAGGPDVQPESIGWLMAADYVPVLGIPDHVDRAMGHIHPEGNPHVHLNPHNILAVAVALAERLAMMDEKNGDNYRRNLDNFRSGWQARAREWERQAAGLEGANVIVYHNGWAYLLGWLGMNAAAELEPRPGIPPTAAHLEQVLQTIKGRNIKAILVAPYERDKAANWLAERTGIPVLRLPYTVGGTDRAHDLQSLFSETVRLLSESGS